MDYQAFNDKFNMVLELYKNSTNSDYVLENIQDNLWLEKLKEKVIDLITEYGKVSDVGVSRCDDMKMKYFLGYSLYECYYEEHKIKSNELILTSVELLSKSWIGESIVIIEKIKDFLNRKDDLGKYYDFKEYYGKFGIYIVAKSIYYEKTDCDKRIKEKPNKSNIVNNVVNNYGDNNKINIDGSLKVQNSNKENTFLETIITFFKKILKLN